MSEALALTRRIYGAWEQGDFSDASWADPEIEFLPPYPGAAPVTGQEAMRKQWSDWLEQWEEFRTMSEEFIERGDRVLVLTRFEGSGKGSGVSASGFPGAALFTVRDGRVVRLALFEDRASAREALDARASGDHA